MTLAPRAPTARDWLHAAVRRPPMLWPAGIALFVLLARRAPQEPTPGWWVAAAVTMFLTSFAHSTWRGRTTDRAFAAVAAGDRARPPRDARTAGPVGPQWSWRGPLGLLCLVGAGGATFVLGVGLDLLRSQVGPPLDGSELVAWSIAAMVVAVATAGLHRSLLVVPGAARSVVRASSRPVAIRLLGVDEQRAWHACEEGPGADDGPGLVLPRFAGRHRLAAGDVVHLWCNTAPGTAPDVAVRLRWTRPRQRCALTGSFGTLWPTVVRSTSTVG